MPQNATAFSQPSMALSTMEKAGTQLVPTGERPAILLLFPSRLFRSPVPVIVLGIAGAKREYGVGQLAAVAAK